MAKRCTNSGPHKAHRFGLDVVQGGYQCQGVEAPAIPRDKQCRKSEPHARHVWRSSVEHECPGVQLGVIEWVQRLNWLMGVQSRKEVCFCDQGWPDRDCPVHFRENSYPEMLKSEAALAVPVLVAEIERQWAGEPRPCVNTKCNGYVTPAEVACGECGTLMLVNA